MNKYSIEMHTKLGDIGLQRAQRQYLYGVLELELIETRLQQQP